MNQEERLDYLIRELCSESDEYRDWEMIKGDRKQIFRSLRNIRLPKPVSAQFLKVQNEYLQEEAKEKGIVSWKDIPTIHTQYGARFSGGEKISIWQGDITRLQVDAIVNAANSGMLGCFCPNHRCIDNAIHSAAGVALREECAKLMKIQGHEEETGKAKITKAYNLPCHHVIHTVGPIISGPLTGNDKKLLASCYRSCLQMAEDHGLKSIAFCCISTGEYHFPKNIAAEIAFQTVKDFLSNTGLERVIFNVFVDEDIKIYENQCSVFGHPSPDE